MKKGLLGSITLGIILLVGVFVIGKCTTRVPAGYNAVQYDINGGIKEDSLEQGWHVTSPTITTTLYTTGLEQSYMTAEKKGDSPNDDSFQVPTSDGKQVTTSLEFSYYFDKNRLAEIFTRFKGKSGEEVKDTFIKDKIKSWSREVTEQYPVIDLLGGKIAEINENLDTHLRAKFEPYGIIIDTVNITDVVVDEETKAAVQKKVNAQQEQELAEIEAKTARINAEKEKEVALIAAEKDKETAQINAEQTIIKAQAAAESTLIKAEAEAEAIAKVAASITGEYIDYTKAQSWNGQVSVVQGSSGAYFDISSVLEGK